MSNKPTSAPRILIEDGGSGKHIAQNTHIWILRDVEDDYGNVTEERVEISHLVRRVAVDMKVGEPLVAKLEVFVAGITTRAQAEEILADYIGRPRWWKRLRQHFTDVTTFNVTGVREFYD